jgi:hypothetical protein
MISGFPMAEPANAHTPSDPTTRRRTNQALLVLVPLAIATGLFSNTVGVDWIFDPATIHGIVALAIAVLTPWKAPIVQRGLGRRRRSRWASLVLLILIAVTLVSGLVHAAALTRKVGPLTIMQIHIGAALIALVLIVAHYRSHPVSIRRTDLDRRAFISGASMTAAAAALWVGWEGGLAVAGNKGADRRFTGSHERGSFDPEAMPVTSWLDDPVQHIERDEWEVRIDGRMYGLADIEALPAEDLTAILDCTSAWYSEQVWTGVRLDRLFDTDKRSIDVSSASGYGRRFPTRDLHRLWLVTHVGGEPLSAGHGFPARIVAPDRRGFWWVKWVTAIEPSDTPSWFQLPFPAT